MRILFFASAVTLCAAQVAAAEVPGINELQKQARAKMRSVDYELAIPLLERALTVASNRSQAAEVQADLGICHASLGDPEQARIAFEGALGANPLLDLPVGTSPKIRRLFEGVRAQGPKATALAPIQAPTIVVAPPEPVGLRVKPVDFVLGGAVVAGLAAGIVTGLTSSNAANELQNGLHDRAMVDSLSSRQRIYGIASVCAYGLAGVAALSELVVLLLRHPEPANAVSVSGAVLSTGGASATVQVRF